MKKQKTLYKEPVTINIPGMVARVYSPILESEERDKRMKIIHRTTANIMNTAGVTQK